MCVGRLDRWLLCCLLNALEHRLQLPARCVRVAQHRVQRDPCLRVTRGLGLLLTQVVLQRNHALPIRTHFGIDGGNNPADLRGNGAIHIGELGTGRLNVRVAGTEASERRLQLRGQLVVVRPQLHNRRCDRRLRGGAGPAAGGVQLPFRLGQRAAGTHQVFGQQADLFAVEPRVHAFHQAVLGTVPRNGILVSPHVLAQFFPSLIQPFTRLGDRAVFHPKL